MADTEPNKPDAAETPARPAPAKRPTCESSADPHGLLTRLSLEVLELRDRLRRDRRQMVGYLDLKRAADDLHGVMDAAADIREIDTSLRMLEWLWRRLDG
jgi:hypothetical protein